MPHCENCGAAMRIDRNRSLFVCDHCGSQEEPPPVVGHLELMGETSHACPICTTPLSNGRLEGYALLSCPRCYGLLIDMDRFVEVIKAVRAREGRSVRTALPRRQNPDDRSIDCPTCSHRMIAHVYAGPGNAVIDSCKRCLVNWLDAGELHRIAIAPDTPPAA